MFDSSKRLNTDFSSQNRGKTLGGGTSINGAAYTRGTKEQYDAWNQMLDPSDQTLGWDWDGIFSYMKKVSTHTDPNLA